MVLGMSQEQLGKALGLSFQQIQKYERGANRVGSSRLFDLANILRVPVSFFFEEMSEDVREMTPSRVGRGMTEASSAAEDMDVTIKRESLKLIHAYCRISDPRVRKELMELIKAVAGPTKVED